MRKAILGLSLVLVIAVVVLPFIGNADIPDGGRSLQTRTQAAEYAATEAIAAAARREVVGHPLFRELSANERARLMELVPSDLDFDPRRYDAEVEPNPESSDTVSAVVSPPDQADLRKYQVALLWDKSLRRSAYRFGLELSLRGDWVVTSVEPLSSAIDD